MSSKFRDLINHDIPLELEIGADVSTVPSSGFSFSCRSGALNRSDLAILAHELVFPILQGLEFEWTKTRDITSQIFVFKRHFCKSYASIFPREQCVRPTRSIKRPALGHVIDLTLDSHEQRLLGIRGFNSFSVISSSWTGGRYKDARLS
ncbi:hypothetical protein ACFX13_038870 [Malus domestica]